MRAWIGIIAGLFLAGTACSAEEGLTPAEMDALRAQPGVQVTQRSEGNAKVTEWKKNGVTISQMQDGKKVTTFGNDGSGKGAVICSWMIYVTLKASLRACPAEKYDLLRSDLEEGIAAIDAFIVVNASIRPVTLEQLHTREGAMDTQLSTAKPDGSGRNPQACGAGEIGKIVEAMNAMPHDARKKQISDLLSIPRWPVLNPCL